ncbi:MAG TPA: NAD-dependent epimerase/dehydratase family protein [Flavisolibacter sp.]|jgi:nucleoside-diphosphate-sugar epimerase|nr:NAD-dependent epimerase/dehydratase family protein [Flavisolibacter sp.]
MNLFLTGATGYIGHQLALAAAAQGYSVTALVRNLSSPHLPLHPAIRFCKGDITEYSSVIKAMKGCDCAMHAAALTQLWHKDSSQFYRINVMGTRNVLEAALYLGIEKLVFTSSCAVLGPSGDRPVTEDDPRFTPFENDYEVSKHCAEELVREYVRRGLHAVIVSPPRVYGPGLDTRGNPINKIIRNTLKRKLAFLPSAKDVVGNYAFIDDVVAGHFKALEKGESGEKYILGGENISYKQFFETISRAGNQHLQMITVPVALLKGWSALVFTANYLVGRHTHLTPKVVERLVQNRALSCEKAIQEINYHITPFIHGMEQTIHHLKTSSHA